MYTAITIHYLTYSCREILLKVLVKNEGPNLNVILNVGLYIAMRLVQVLQLGIYIGKTELKTNTILRNANNGANWNKKY